MNTTPKKNFKSKLGLELHSTKKLNGPSANATSNVTNLLWSDAFDDIVHDPLRHVRLFNPLLCRLFFYQVILQCV